MIELDNSGSKAINIIIQKLIIQGVKSITITDTRIMEILGFEGTERIEAHAGEIDKYLKELKTKWCISGYWIYEDSIIILP